jgi:DNA modification methylase
MNKQEFLNGQITLYNGDCLEVMQEMKDGEVDLVLTDPPYCVGTSSNGHKASWNDNNLIKPFFKIAINELSRILKNEKHIYIHTDWRTYSLLFPICLEKFLIKNCIVWDYGWIKAGNAYRFRHEFIIFGCKGDFKNTWGNSDSDVWNIKCVNFTDKSRLHSAQKPVEIAEKIIKNSSKENDLIFDGFSGSGTTAIACIRMNRRFIGCELDNEYFDLSCKRIEEELRQGNLF